MHNMEIHLNEITYNVIPYGKRNGQTVLLENKTTTRVERYVCIGDELNIINDPKYNSNLLNTLKNLYSKGSGNKIEIIKSQSLSQHGFTNHRFE